MEKEVVGGSSTAEESHAWVCTRESALSDAPPKKWSVTCPPFPTPYTSTALINRSRLRQKEDGRRYEKQGLTAYIWPTALMSPVWLGRICLVLLLCRIVVSDTKLTGVLAWNKLNIQLNCFFHTYLSKCNNYRYIVYYAYSAHLLFLITLSPKTI